MTELNSDDVSLLIRSNELLTDILEEVLTESNIDPESLINVIKF